MAYSIAYKESSLLTPYDDWIKRNNPNRFYINYIVRNAKEEYECMFWPKQNLLQIWVRTADHEFAVFARVNIDATTKRIKILSSQCKSCRVTVPGYKPYIYDPLKNEHGRTKMAYQMINEYKDMRILETIAHNIFGKEYSFAPSGGNKLLDNQVIKVTFKKIADLVPCKIMPGSWTLLGAYCDMTEDNAATKIQAAFRGWRVRMQYRYNPHNCLGRYIILKEADF